MFKSKKRIYYSWLKIYLYNQIINQKSLQIVSLLAKILNQNLNAGEMTIKQDSDKKD